MIKKDDLFAIGISFALIFSVVNFKEPGISDYILFIITGIIAILFIFNVFLKLKLKKMKEYN